MVDLRQSCLFLMESKLIGFANENVEYEWTNCLDYRVKWFFLSLGQFRTDMADGNPMIITDVLGLDMPRHYHKDGLAADARTKDMTRLVREIMRKYSFDLRNSCRTLTEPVGWRYGFDPHDDYQQHDPPWLREHFHGFVKEKRV